MFCLDTNRGSYLLRQPSVPLVRHLIACQSAKLCLTELILDTSYLPQAPARHRFGST